MGLRFRRRKCGPIRDTCHTGCRTAAPVGIRGFRLYLIRRSGSRPILAAGPAQAARGRLRAHYRLMLSRPVGLIGVPTAAESGLACTHYAFPDARAAD
jgi:hypothetical protein